MSFPPFVPGTTQDRPLRVRGAAQAQLRRGTITFLALLLLSITTLVAVLSATSTPQPAQAQQAKTDIGKPQPPTQRAGADVPLPYEVEGQPQHGSATPDRQGGPDAFGYIFSDDRDPGGPTYNWIPGAQRIGDGAWTRARTGDPTEPEDDGVVTYTLSFPFNFYGTSYTQAHVSTNGNVHFGAPNDYWPQKSSECVPSTNQYVPKAMVAPLWFDFVVPVISDTIQPGGVYTDIIGSAPNRIYVVEWRNVYQYQNPGIRATFETLIHENGDIIHQYQALNGTGVSGSRGVVGIQNAAGTIGLAYLCYQDDLSVGRAIRYRVQQDVFLQPGSRSGGGAPGATVIYTESVANNTGINNSFSLSVPSSVWTTTINPPNTGLIANGSRANVLVQVQIPPGTPLGASDVARIEVRSDLPTSGFYTDTALITKTVSTQGVDFVPPRQTKAGDYGAPITFTTSLVNKSGQNNSFAITLEGADWQASVVPSMTGQIAPEASTPISVTLLVPSGATLGASDVLTLTAIGQLPSPGQFYGQSVLTATAGVWTRVGDMPLPRSRHAAAAFTPNGRVYVLGGEFNNGSTALPIAEYDPLTDGWSQRVNLNIGVSNVGAGVIDNAIYVPGGYGGDPATTQSLLQVYYPLEDRASLITTDPLPAPRFGAAVAVFANKLYVIGGSDDTLQTKNTVFEYDPTRPAGSRWQTRAPMPTARVYLAAATMDGFIYAAGGVPGTFTDLNTMEVYNPLTNEWSTTTPMSRGRAGLALVGIDSGAPGCGGYLYAVGGGYLNYTNSVERFNPTTVTWEPASSLTLARRTLAAVYSPNTYALIATGGWDNNYQPRTESIDCAGNLQLPTATPVTPQPTVTPGGCPVEFEDVPAGSTFHPYVRCLACEGILSGYPCGGLGEPCSDPPLPYFRPNVSLTRGQLAKIVSESAGFTDPVSGQTFEDVMQGSTFYTYIERLILHEVMEGYPCGGPGEPCGIDYKPYFRPNSISTRGQLTKIVSNAAGFEDEVVGQTFEDVMQGSTFYTFTERLATRDVIGGYPCGGPDEPCGVGNRPYFRPNNTVTRAQSSKIVSNTFFPNCTP